jgi:hypothetical protein
MVDGVYGYVYAFDVSKLPPTHVADMPIFKEPTQTPKPGWVSFSLDGKYAYPVRDDIPIMLPEEATVEP